MSKYINPFTDTAFKRIFGQEEHKSILIGFLNTLLEDEVKISDVTYLDKENVGLSEVDRTIIYDVYCTTDSGDHVIVEMQNQAQGYFKDRSIFYMASAVTHQSRKGREWRYDIKAVYGVFFMNFKFPGIRPGLRNDVVLAYKGSDEQFSDKMRMIYICLPEMTKSEQECENNFERWIYVMKNLEQLQKIPYKQIIDEMLAFEDVAEYGAMNEAERRRYDRDLKRYRDNLAVLDYSVNEGREEGMRQGRAEGIAQGREEAVLEIAKNMKNAGMDINKIADLTGIESKAIEAL